MSRLGSDDIEELTLDELAELNKLICDRMAELQARQDLAVLRRLHLGQRVAFRASEGDLEGKVVKINRKTVIIESDDHRQWKVAAGLLTLRDGAG